MAFGRTLILEDSFHYLAYSVLFLMSNAGTSILFEIQNKGKSDSLIYSCTGLMVACVLLYLAWKALFVVYFNFLFNFLERLQPPLLMYILRDSSSRRKCPVKLVMFNRPSLRPFATQDRRTGASYLSDFFALS